LPDILSFSEKPVSLKKITETWESCFNKKFNSEYFNWRFLDNPNEKKVYILYIMDNDTLAAFYSVSPMILRKKNGGMAKIALANMTMTHPAHRGKGFSQFLALKLYAQLKEEGYACVFSYPVREKMHHIFKKYLNFHDVAILKTMRLSKRNFQYNYLDKLTFECDIVNDEIIEIALSLTFTDKQYSLLRNDVNLRWRLIDNPVYDYHYVKIFRDNKVSSVLFYKYYGDSIDIMDYCYTNTDVLWGSEFSFGLGQLFENNTDSVKNINIWAEKGSNKYNILKNMRFQPEATNTYFGIIPLEEDSDLLYGEKWHNSYLDSDVY